MTPSADGSLRAERDEAEREEKGWNQGQASRASERAWMEVAVAVAVIGQWAYPSVKCSNPSLGIRIEELH